MRMFNPNKNKAHVSCLETLKSVSEVKPNQGPNLPPFPKAYGRVDTHVLHEGLSQRGAATLHVCPVQGVKARPKTLAAWEADKGDGRCSRRRPCRPHLERKGYCSRRSAALLGAECQDGALNDKPAPGSFLQWLQSYVLCY